MNPNKQKVNMMDKNIQIDSARTYPIRANFFMTLFKPIL